MWTRVGSIWHALSLLPIWRSIDNHTRHHLKRHVCLRSKEWAYCMERAVVHLYVRSFTTNQSLHNQKDHVFIVDVVVIDLMWETMFLNVINQPTITIAKPIAIAKIHKYRTFHEGHHFILMAMVVHGTLGVIWIISSRNVLVFSMINDKIIDPCFFTLNFLNNMLVLLFSVF